MATERERAHEQLAAIYAEHAPDKASGIGKLLDKYAGREDELLRKVRAKYSGGAPTKPRRVPGAGADGTPAPSLARRPLATAPLATPRRQSPASTWRLHA